MKIAMSRRTFLGTTASAAAAMAVGGWRHSAAASAFTMQAAWINDAEFMGYFIAIDKGWYADEGLDLTYLSGGPDVIPESSLLSNKADLALTTPDTTAKAVVDQGADFRIIGTQYQKNPIGVVSLASNPVNEPKDLIGKTLAVPPVNVISVEAMFRLNGIEPGAVKVVPYAYDPTPLVKGEIDASIDFTTNVPYTISQVGPEAVSFLLYDFGFTIYNDTVVVSTDTLKSKRKELVAWLRASRRGWEENFTDTDGWPPKFADTWFKGTGRTIANEVFFNNAQRALMESPAGFFALTDEGVEKNIEALGQVGIKAPRDMFDQSLLEEI